VANQMSTNDQGAKQRAAELADTAKSETKGVADDAKQEASAVVSEAGTQVQNVVGEAVSSLQRQADDGAGRAAGALGDFGSRLQALAEGDVERAGDLGRYAADLGQRLSGAADRLGDRGIEGLIGDVQRFARRRPGMFLAAAATTGFAAGRLFRGARAEASSDSEPDYGMQRYSDGRTAVAPGPDPWAGAPTGTPGTLPVGGSAAEVPRPAPPAYGGTPVAPAPPPPYGTLPGEPGGSR
jgi:hypothetical protein